MNVSDENKINKLLDLLEEVSVICKRIEVTSGQLQKELREALNASWTAPPAA